MFNIIARRSLLEHAERHPMVADRLFEWYHEMVRSDFSNFNELKQAHGNASLVGDDRVVFNIAGNKYRLVVRIIFEFRTIQIKWFGPHSAYDLINAKTIQPN